jgi:phosphoserine phosphatase RsbU/P
MHICWTEGPERLSHELTEGETIIGRHPDCQIVVGNSQVSRRHAQITGASGTYIITDLESTNGTYVNGVRVTEYILKDADRIELGKDRIPLLFTADPTKFPGDDIARFERALLDLKLSEKDETTTLERISWILDFQQQWGRTLRSETAFDEILHSALKLSGAERAFILIRHQQKFSYTAGMLASGAKLEEKEFRASRSVVDHVGRTGTPVFMVERLDDAFAAQASVIASGATAIACLPLQGIPVDAGSTGLLGILYLDSTRPMHALTGLDEKILRKLAADASNVLERLELISNIEQRKTLERELALAEEAQNALLPRTIPRIPGWEIAAFSKPTRYVGGDFYDFIRTREDSFVAALGDVSGKGVSAALVSSMVLGSLHAQIHSQKSLESAAGACNHIMREKSPAERFVTFFLAEFRIDGGGKYLNAGHTTAYVYRSHTRTIEELPSNNMLVGAFDFSSFQCSPLGLDAGDVLLSYSDGLTEAENHDGQMFGEERTLSTMRSGAESGARALLTQLTQDLDEFTGGRPQSDDITIMAIGRVK